jgi:hypothetical protein
MPWYGIVVRGDQAAWTVGNVGPIPDEASCLKALIQEIQRAGFKASIEGEHDRGHGYLVGGKHDDGTRLAAIAWPTEFMSQGCLEIFFERLGLLAKPLPRLCPRTLGVA